MTLLDTAQHIETPEGVELTLRTAGPAIRAVALGLDFLIRIFVYSTAGGVLSYLGDVGIGIQLIAVFLGEFVYPIGFEVLNHGATPGKMAMGIVVVRDDGTPVNVQASVVRNLVRWGDMLPFGYVVGLMSVLSNREFKRLGDMAAGTLVVYRDRLQSEARPIDASPLPAPTTFQPDEQRAIIDFAERLPTWTQDRADELAEILNPVFERPVDHGRVRQVAAWLRGARIPEDGS